MPTINVKVDDSLKKRVWRKATAKPGRTVSDWVRDVLERETSPAKRLNLNLNERE